MKTFVLTVVLMALIIGASFLGAWIGNDVATPVICFVLIFAAFKVHDGLYPQPSNLTKDEVKSFFTSKIFWAAFLNLIFVVLNGLVGWVASPDTAEMILALDWTQVPQALLSVVIIVLRKTDILKKLF